MINRRIKYGINNICWYPFKKNSKILYAGDYNLDFVSYLDNKCEIKFIDLLVDEINESYDYIIIDQMIDGVLDKKVFLEGLLPFLKEDGNVIILTNNKLALRYFAGVKDDLFDEVFGNFNEGSTLYTKKQWEDLFKSLNVQYRFYYPFPDARITTQVLTDEWINSGLNLKYENDKDYRYTFFDEENAYNELKECGDFSTFSNSFFIVLGKENKNIIYSKISSERLDKYQIYTNIIKKDDTLMVEKISLNESGVNHIKTIYDFYVQNKSNSFYEYCPVKKNENTLTFDFIEGKTLEELIENLLNKKKYDEVEKYVDVIYRILSDSKIDDFKINDVFKKVFGDFNFENEKSIYFCNIDLIPENIIKNGNNQFTIIDYEWFFKCYVPISFVMYRALLHSNSISKLPSCILDKLYERYGITESLKKIYYQMELNLQSYVSDHKIEDLFNDRYIINLPFENNSKYILEISDESELIYKSYNPRKVNLELNVSHGLKKLKLNAKSIFKVISLELNGETIDFQINADIVNYNDYYCLNQPVISIDCQSEGILKLSLEIFYFNEDCIDNIVYLMQENAKLNNELNQIKSSVGYRVGKKIKVIK